MRFYYSLKILAKLRWFFVIMFLTIMIGGIWIIGNIKGLAAEQGQSLTSVEIREYQGEDLSSIIDFRENSIKGSQKVNIDEYRLEIIGLIQEAKTFTYQDILDNHKHYKKVATLYCVEGWDAKILWEGILVRDLIGIDNIKPEAKTVIFHAQDGYTTSFPVDYIMDNDILLAYKMNEIILPAVRGFPFQLVAESKWGYKWIKWVTKIELSDDEDYQGFWESRGYNNEGDLDESFFK
jgi:DMSO/TMAO reductase YedYZ molybdopterin-dependent catalytic subunit